MSFEYFHGRLEVEKDKRMAQLEIESKWLPSTMYIQTGEANPRTFI